MAPLWKWCWKRTPRSGSGRGPPRSGGGRGPPGVVVEEDPHRSGGGREPPPPHKARTRPDQLRSTAGQAGGMP